MNCDLMKMRKTLWKMESATRSANVKVVTKKENGSLVVAENEKNVFPPKVYKICAPIKKLKFELFRFKNVIILQCLKESNKN